MVPVEVPENVPVVIEVSTPVSWVVPEPEASAKRPVPPVIVKEAVSWNAVGEVGQATSMAELKSSSPFAAVKVSCSFAVNPPAHGAEPVAVAVFANVIVPRCSNWPVPVMVASVADVRVKLPEKLPLKGLEWEAKATGNAPSNATTARIVGITIIFLILILTPPF